MTNAIAPEVEIVLSAPVNLRDLGGISIADGTLRTGLAIRADDLSLVTFESAGELVAEGLKAVIDLRSPEEVAVTGRGPLSGYALGYHHVPLMSDISSSMDKDRPRLDHDSMGQMYLGMVDQAAPQLVTALNVIAHAPGASAFHCAAGRDRTGVLAAMLLLALGASDEAIVNDYARTGPNMGAIINRTRSVSGPMMAKLGFDLDEMNDMHNSLLEGSMEVSMQILLGRLRELHGDPLLPLREAGLSDATVSRLRERALAH